MAKKQAKKIGSKKIFAFIAIKRGKRAGKKKARSSVADDRIGKKIYGPDVVLMPDMPPPPPVRGGKGRK